VYVERDCGGEGGRSSVFFPSGSGVDLLLPELRVSRNPDSLKESMSLIQGRIEELYRILAGAP
jgi:hypothetical protein